METESVASGNLSQLCSRLWLRGTHFNREGGVLFFCFSGRFRVVRFQRENDGCPGLIQTPNPLVTLPQLKRSSRVSGQGHHREAFFHVC